MAGAGRLRAAHARRGKPCRAGDPMGTGVRRADGRGEHLVELVRAGAAQAHAGYCGHGGLARLQRPVARHQRRDPFPRFARHLSDGHAAGHLSRSALRSQRGGPRYGACSTRSTTQASSRWRSRVALGHMAVEIVAGIFFAHWLIRSQSALRAGARPRHRGGDPLCAAAAHRAALSPNASASSCRT